MFISGLVSLTYVDPTSGEERPCGEICDPPHVAQKSCQFYCPGKNMLIFICVNN